MTKSHTAKEYDNQLRELSEGLLLMASRVEEMIENSIKALTEGDRKLAEQTIDSDRQVNSAEVEIDEKCLLILAKRQPMASDLRFITLSLTMVTDLERIGDLAVNICERVLDLSHEESLGYSDEIQLMSTKVRGMVRDAIDAFIERDAKKAQAIIDGDDEVDKLYTKVFRDVLALMLKDSSTVERGIHVQSIAKWLERMADHSTNLAEQVIFMVNGLDIRHLGKLESELNPEAEV